MEEPNAAIKRQLKGSIKLHRLVNCFLAEFESLTWSAQCADIHASLRSKLKNAGSPIGGFDTLIATHALALNLTLTTHNVRHFEKVPRLHVEDWVNG